MNTKMLQAKLDEHIFTALTNNPDLFKTFTIDTKIDVLDYILVNLKNIPLTNLAIWYQYDPDLIKQYLHELIYETRFSTDIYQYKDFINFCVLNMDLLIQNEDEALYYLDIFKRALKKQNVNYFIKHLIVIYDGDEEAVNIIIAKIKNELPYSKKLLKKLKFMITLV